MDDKTKLELYKQLEEMRVKEREKSDTSYARKIIETLVFGFVGMAMVALVGALFKLVILQ